MTREEFERRAASGENCGLYREALRQDWPDWALRTRSGIYWCRMLPDRNEQLAAWLNESLLTALEHDEPKIALRGLLQAVRYFGQLQEHGSHVGVLESDALAAAKHRVEGFLRERQS